MKLAFLVECTLFGLMTAACGPEAVDPFATPTWQFAFISTSTNESAVAMRSESAALSVDGGSLWLRSFEMVPCSTDAAPISLSSLPIDLADDPPTWVAVETSVRDYCAIRLAIAPSANLEDLSFHLSGTRSDDVPFEIRSALELDLELRAPSGARFDAQGLAVGFDLAVWFTGADVGDATAAGGVVVIDSGSNAAVLTAVEANTSLAVALYVDADRDGALDADELTPIAIAQ